MDSFKNVYAVPGFAVRNHAILVLRWSRAPERASEKEKKNIVGFEVYPKSISAIGRKEDSFPPSGEVTDNPFILNMPLTATDLRDAPDTPVHVLSVLVRG